MYNNTVVTALKELRIALGRLSAELKPEDYDPDIIKALYIADEKARAALLKFEE